jgi:methylenetetrahydrofolate--tRNA-(uracil-5-)-methyltransferase
MLGALAHYVTHASPKDFQPMKANFGLFAPPEGKLSKGDRAQWYSQRALTSLRRFTRAYDIPFDRAAAEQDPALDLSIAAAVPRGEGE